jgi:hypothetical protein
MEPPGTDQFTVNWFISTPTVAEAAVSDPRLYVSSSSSSSPSASYAAAAAAAAAATQTYARQEKLRKSSQYSDFIY